MRLSIRLPVLPGVGIRCLECPSSGTQPLFFCLHCLPHNFMVWQKQIELSHVPVVCSAEVYLNSVLSSVREYLRKHLLRSGSCP